MTSFYWIITILFFISSTHILIASFEQVYLYIKARKPNNQHFAEAKLTDDLPFVTVQLPLYNERHVFEGLLKNAFLLNYPKDRFEIQVLDDSTDETTELIANFIEENTPIGLSVVHIRRKDRQGFKAGNLKNGLLSAKGEFIAMFDADFVIPQDFLLQTIKSFEQEDVAAVQTRWGHLNEDQSVLTRIQGLLINSHFLVEQYGRYKAGWMVQFSGTAGIWRKKAIINAGGWQSDTLIEDVDLSIRAQLKGWKIKIRPDIVCQAELPNTLQGLKIQQFRWMQGGAEVTRKHLKALWKSDFSLSKKYHGTLHLSTGFLFPSLFLMCITSIPMIYAIPALKIPIEFLAVFTLTILFNGIPLFAVNVGEAWKNQSIIQRLKCFLSSFPAMILIGPGIALHNSVGIIKGVLGIYTPFQRTPKINLTSIKDEINNNNQYRVKAGSIAIVESILAFYFLFGVFLGIKSSNFVFVGFHILLFLAYIAISKLSTFAIVSKKY